ncbi:MAG: hypothetical protein ACYSW6_11440 [Planctomycetota bacterium]|jgi:hypothetical protein
MKRAIFILAFLLIPAITFAANTTTVGPSEKSIEITGLDVNWVWTTDLAAESSNVSQAKVKAIIFYPSAANDRMIIRDGGIDEATIFDSGAVSGADDPRIVYIDPPSKIELVIDISDCTLDTAANAKVVILLERR